MNCVMSLIIVTCLIVFQAGSSSNGHVLDEVPLIDGHNDFAYNFYKLIDNNLHNFHADRDLSKHHLFGKKHCSTCHTDIPRLRKGKVGTQFWAAYVDCKTQYKDAVARTLEQIDVIKRFVEKYPSHLEFVTSVSGIEKANKAKKIASLIGVEGGHSIDSRLAVLRMYYELGVRYMTLTHMCDTPWADSSLVDVKKNSTKLKHLTKFGKIVVKEMNRLGMLVDISHVSHGVMDSAIRVSRAPVIFSHSSAYAVNHHHRNVQDDILKLVKRNKGIVMINFYTEFISPHRNKSTIEDVAAHINHIAKLIGPEYIGIGADYDGVPETPTGLEDVSKYPKLFDHLQKNDPNLWTDSNLQKLAGLNFLRVFKEAEEVRDKLKHEEPHQDWISEKELDKVKNIWQCRLRKADEIKE